MIPRDAQPGTDRAGAPPVEPHGRAPSPDAGSPRGAASPMRIGACLLALVAAGVLLDARTGWFDRAFDLVAHQFYEIPVLAALRRPTQLPLARFHVFVLATVAAVGCLAWPRLAPRGRSLVVVLSIAYAIRAGVWIAGGNLPLVPADSSHYVEVATSVYRGEGPVKHYVESFFIEYPAIREGRGTLDDWATPLYAYVLAGVYRLVGIVPGQSVERTFAVAKGASFVLNLLSLAALYGFACRAYGRRAGLVVIWILALLPVHAVYAGFALRESLVALTSILAIWLLVESWATTGRRAVALAVAAGLAGGLAVLARTTAVPLLAACAVYGVIVHRRSHLQSLILWAGVVLITILPWAWTTYRVYGEPFFSYTNYFRYTFSWAVHHYQTGAPSAGTFFTRANAPEILRVKVKSILIIAAYSTMILSLPVALAALFRVWTRAGDTPPMGRTMDRLTPLLAGAFVLATLAGTSDVTQVAQLGRYFLPLYCLILPTAAAGIVWWSLPGHPRGIRMMAIATLAALLWADPTWAHDVSWLVSPFQLHLPAMRAAGEWIRQHPAAVPSEARVMAWFPWEMRLLSQRTTILMPRNFDARRNLQTIGDGPFGYHVTHVLWGSFETPPHLDAESFAPYLARLRLETRLTDANEVYRSPPGLPFPVRLYRLRDAGQ